ncbi:MAG TPA: succinate dehydrogenase cytochrome b subunit [Vicinamibacterales bacterium]|nr:succinate dehydrogenase cytochrome b subunit [Vicinamibacterales bacterium]
MSSSSVGTKVLIAFTGLALFGFLIVHLAGNLLLLSGPEAFNAYSHKLLSNPLIYLAEAGLAAIFLVHVWKTGRNFGRNRAARPSRYDVKRPAGHTSRKTMSSTTMILSGTTILVFLILHLKTFKFGTWYDSAEPGVRDLYRLTIEVFHQPGYVIWYVIAMVLVGMHLRHGITSALQSLGAIPAGMTRTVLAAGAIVAALIAGGFAMIPIWVYLFTQ